MGDPLAKGAAWRLPARVASSSRRPQALVLGLQVVEASLKGLAAGTQDGLHTLIIGEALTAAALPQPRSRNQLQLDALTRYTSRKRATLFSKPVLSEPVSEDSSSLVILVI